MDNVKRDIFGKTELDRKMAAYSGKDCEICKHPLSFSIKQYCEANIGRYLCFTHQKELEAKNAH